MEEFSGVVFKVWEKPVGGRTLYSFNFDGEKTYYGMGEDRKSGVIESGYNVTVRVEKNDKGYYNVKAVKVNEKGDSLVDANGKPKNSGGGGGGNGGGGKSSSLTKEEWAAKDAINNYQSARAQAVTTVFQLLAADCLEFPKGATKTNKEGRRIALDGFIDLYTAKYFADTQNAAELGSIGRAGDETAMAASVSPDPEDTAPEAAAEDDGFEGVGESGGDDDGWQ